MKDDEYRALIEQAELIREMQKTPGWEVLRDYWHQQTRNAKHAVLNGNVASIEKYKAMTGELIGVYKVLDTLLSLDGVIENERERRAQLTRLNDA